MLKWLKQQWRLMAGPSVPASQRIALLLGMLLAVLLFSANGWFQYLAQRKDHIDQAERQAQKQLISLQDHTLLQLDAADAYLRTARSLMRETRDWRTIQEKLGAVRSVRASNYTGLMLVTDRTGKLTYYSENETPPDISFADRPYFKAFLEDPQDRVFIDATRRGAISGELHYRLVRPILKDGRFDGVILVTMLPEDLTRFFDNLSLGPHSVSNVVTDSHLLIARSPAPAESAFNQPLKVPKEWEATEHEVSGKFNSISPLDGEHRLLFFNRLPGYGLIIFVGISERDVEDELAEIRNHIIAEAAGMLVLVLVLGLLMLRLLGELNERRQVVWALQSLNTVHKVLSGSNQAVLRAATEEGVYQAMCDAIVTHGAYRMAWIGLVSEDGRRMVNPVASAGHVEGYLSLLRISLNDERLGNGPSGMAVRTGRTEINPNFESNPKMGPWRQAALERGYRSSISLPLRALDKVFGILCVYAAKVDAFGPEEVSLFEELAADLSHGVMALRLRRENDVMSGALVQAQKMQALGNLTGGIAHDFNNLLQVILSNLDLALRQGGEASLSRYLRNAMHGAENGAKLTGQLLAFARRQPLTPEPLRLDLLVEDMANLLQRTLGAPIHIVTETAADLWTALADANQLRNAILNLAINARDAMPDGGRLTISLGNVQTRSGGGGMKPGDYVSLEISDTGSGMSPDVLAQAFDPFFTTKPEGAGTGLGLSMVYGFAKQSGGHVGIESTPGLGTSVTLYLPRSWRMPASPQAEKARQLPAGHGEVILLVEDNDEVRSSVQDQLTDLGYRVLVAANGEQGLERLASSEPIDLLFTDLVMPGPFNGRDLAVQGRSLRPGLKVLFTSGYAQASMLDEGHLDDGISLLGKPYRLEQLAETIRRALAAEPLRLLLAEDDQLICEAMLEILENNGYSPVATSTVTEALAILEMNPGFAAIVADKNLAAGGDGIALLQEARRGHPDAMLVLITGQDLPPGSLGDLPATVLHKPFHPRNLLDLLSKGR